MKLGIVAFANESGLGYQTRRLCDMLKPDRVLLVNSTQFSKNKQLHTEWYDAYTGILCKGIPTNQEVIRFTQGLTHILLCENPINFYLLSLCKQRGIHLYIQTNYEFCDHLKQKLPLPAQFIMPSYWMVEEMKKRFGSQLVTYVPPPIQPDEFALVREENMFRRGKRRFIHIVGTLAVHDRNGTLDLLEALGHTTTDFDLVVYSQHQLPEGYRVAGVEYRIGSVASPAELYRDADALILPRRYGGLSLTTNEALMSGLPVIMSDISPNNQLLPHNWVVQAAKIGSFTARTEIDIYKTNSQRLAATLDTLATLTDPQFQELKKEAFQLAVDSFSPAAVLPIYTQLWK